jgi:hypothetical protein
MNARTAWVSAAALFVTVTATTASSHIVDIAWSSERRFMHATVVEPGKFVEVCGKLDAGDEVRWEFRASAPLDFNIHYHVGKDAEYPERKDKVVRGEDVLRVKLREDYCWMWTNRSAGRVDLDVRLERPDKGQVRAGWQASVEGGNR